MAQPYRFRPAFGQVKSLFRGARRDTYPRFTGLLDLYSGAAAAYSLRALRNNIGNVVNVRRSSDDAEQAFTAKEVSDGTLVDWVGAGFDGFVETWYDQSGNGRNATQSTAASQPKIVDGGVVVTENNTPTIDFTGDKFLALTSSTQFVSVFSIHRATAAFQGLFGKGNSTHLSTGSNVDNRVYRFRGYGDTERYVNGAAYANESVPSLGYHLLTITDSSEPFVQIGANPDYNAFKTSFPKIGVMVYYNSDQSANRAAIEANIAAQYGITLA